jgi:hypothetical protein
MGKVCVVAVYVFSKFGGIMPLFLTFIIFNILSYKTVLHSFILRHLPRPVLLYLHRFSAQQEKPPQGAAEPRIELGPALQQADAHYELSYATPLWCGGLCLHSQRRGEDQGPDGTDHLRVRADRQIVVPGALFFLHVVLLREKLNARL